MESDHKKHKLLTKRRTVYSKQLDSADEDDDLDDASHKEKPRCKPRRRKNNASAFDEDIIDGFAIISFKSFDDLEVCPFHVCVLHVDRIEINIKTITCV